MIISIVSFMQKGYLKIFIYSFAYLLTPRSKALLEKLTGSTASQEIPRIFGTRKFITVFTSARHLSLSWTNSIQSPQPPPNSWRSILILSSNLRLGLPNGLFLWVFPTRFIHSLIYSILSHPVIILHNILLGRCFASWEIISVAISNRTPEH